MFVFLWTKVELSFIKSGKDHDFPLPGSQSHKRVGSSTAHTKKMSMIQAVAYFKVSSLG